MYRLVLLVLFVATVWADSDDMKKKCHRLGHPGTMHCCKSAIMPDINIDNIKECMELPHNPHSCEPDICIAKKRGYVSDDGTLDKDAFLKKFSEDYKESATLVEAVKENCLGGSVDLNSFGPPDECELIKIKHCIHRQALNDCKEWDDSGPCAGIKDLVKECAKLDP